MPIGDDMRSMAFSVLLAGLVIPTIISAAAPEGWIKAGEDPSSYTMELDPTVAHEGKSSVKLASTRKPTGFGTMMQVIDAAEYRGKRLRYSGFVMAANVGDWAGLWMRVDGPGRKTLGFDNMHNRPIKGTMDWARHEIVLDVPVEAIAIAFGLLIEGEGELWLDDVKLEIVDEIVPGGSPGGPRPGG